LERDRQTIGRCIVELPADSAVRGLAEEAGGNLQGHIELISKLVK
jgi:hypothetical protein